MTKINRGVAMRFLLLMFLMLALPVTQCFATSLTPFENLTEDIGQGFGDTWNRYAWSMEESEGSIYVGTWNCQFDYPALLEGLRNGEVIDLISGGGSPLEGIKYVSSTGGEIWRHDGGQSWTQVVKASEDNVGFRGMINYNGQLYATTANSTNGAELWVKNADETWSKVDGWDRGVANNSVRTLCVRDGELFIGTENNATGGELWTFDGSSFEHKATFDAIAVSEISVFTDKNGSEKMYVGTWDFNSEDLRGAYGYIPAVYQRRRNHFC